MAGSSQEEGSPGSNFSGDGGQSFAYLQNTGTREETGRDAADEIVDDNAENEDGESSHAESSDNSHHDLPPTPTIMERRAMKMKRNAAMCARIDLGNTPLRNNNNMHTHPATTRTETSGTAMMSLVESPRAAGREINESSTSEDETPPKKHG